MAGAAVDFFTMPETKGEDMVDTVHQLVDLLYGKRKKIVQDLEEEEIKM